MVSKSIGFGFLGMADAMSCNCIGPIPRTRHNLVTAFFVKKCLTGEIVFGVGRDQKQKRFENSI
jgi:hypothetical protein